MEQNKDQDCNVCSGINGNHDDRCGAAVRGEAVVEFTYKGPDGRFLDSGEWWVENSEIGNHMALPILRNGKTIALVFSEAHDDCEQEIEENCRLLCCAGNAAHAADAPSEPSKREKALEEYFQASEDWIKTVLRGDDDSDMDKRFYAARAAVDAAPVKSRAADALDSQPTGRPTVKQLAAQLCDSQMWTVAEQNAFAEVLACFPNESSQGIISLGNAWKHGQAFGKAQASSQPTDDRCSECGLHCKPGACIYGQPTDGGVRK